MITDQKADYIKRSILKMAANFRKRIIRFEVTDGRIAGQDGAHISVMTRDGLWEYNVFVSEVDSDELQEYLDSVYPPHLLDFVLP